MGRRIRQHLFLLVGLFTLGLYASLSLVPALGPLVRVLIIPAYVGWLAWTWLVISLTGPLPSPLPLWVNAIGALVALVPYFGLDWLRHTRST